MKKLKGLPSRAVRSSHGESLAAYWLNLHTSLTTAHRHYPGQYYSNCKTPKLVQVAHNNGFIKSCQHEQTRQLGAYTGGPFLSAPQTQGCLQGWCSHISISMETRLWRTSWTWRSMRRMMTLGELAWLIHILESHATFLHISTRSPSSPIPLGVNSTPQAQRYGDISRRHLISISFMSPL